MKSEKGFTFIEIVTVIVIIALVTRVVFVNMNTSYLNKNITKQQIVAGLQLASQTAKNKLSDVTVNFTDNVIKFADEEIELIEDIVLTSPDIIYTKSGLPTITGESQVIGVQMCNETFDVTVYKSGNIE
ncbi:MAG: prepilin-type N-terminal cleavage/methylation domain-containing protein [Clostridia bacterium]|jgi:prepilin-type N-terminal cleavage/methylation domain-containing protein|nr:prepilin-type N-terminal cleavage/methylation domain-containing protein [Clostridia bacterium]